MTETIKNPNKVFAKYKDHHKDKITDIKDFLADPDNKQALDSDAQDELKKLRKSLEDQFKRMESEWQETMKQLTDDTQIDELDELVKETKKSVKEGTKIATRELKARAAKANNSEPPSVTRDSKPWKPMDSFKPNVLDLNDQPTVLETWIRSLRAWLPEADKHSKSEKGLYQINALLEQVMSESTRSAIKFDPTKRTPIFEGDANLVKDLRDAWNRNHPLAKLRVGFFEFQSQPGESWDSWIARLLEQASQAKAREIDGETLNHTGNHELQRPTLKEDQVRNSKIEPQK